MILLEIFSFNILIWFILFYFKFTKLNPSIGYVFIIIPVLYLYVNIILYRKNDLDKVFILSCFTIIDIVPIIILLWTNRFKLEFKSLILLFILVLIYLLYNKSINIDINKKYENYLFNMKYFIK